jgi:trans-aconitate methyltransferase
MSLFECARDTDKLQHGYLPHYEHHLRQNEISVLVEVGVDRGGSLRMWHEWLPEAKVIGIDIEDFCSELADPPGIEVIIADAAKLDLGFHADVIIDDGSHHGDDQVSAFQHFWPWLNPGGWYVIEDLETAWHASFRNGPEVLSLFHLLLMDSLLGRTPSARDSSYDVMELHSYEQIMFLRKGLA